MNDRFHEIESVLDSYRFREPQAGLRDRVLSNLPEANRLPKAEVVLRVAIAALVVTLAWGQWQERQTAERMAQLAVPRRDAPVHGASGFSMFEMMGQSALAAVFNPRVRLPLPEGYASTRLAMPTTTCHWTRQGDDEYEPRVDTHVPDLSADWPRAVLAYPTLAYTRDRRGRADRRPHGPGPDPAAQTCRAA